MALADILARAAQGDSLIDGDIVAYLGGFAYYDADAVVYKHTLAYYGAGVDIDARLSLGAGAEQKGEELAALGIEPMGYAVINHGLYAAVG